MRKITPQEWFGAEILERLEAEREARKLDPGVPEHAPNIYFQVAAGLIVGTIAFGVLYLWHLTGL